MKKISYTAEYLLRQYPFLSEKTAIELAREAVIAARAAGSNIPSSIIFDNVDRPTVSKHDPHHYESRTGIRAGKRIALKWWNTYHYVPTICEVSLPRL